MVDNSAVAAASEGAGTAPAGRWLDALTTHRKLLIGLIFGLALLPLLTTPVLPFIDFYNHLARYYVLSHLGQSALLAQNYAANWQLLPNIGLDVVVTLLLTVLPPAAAAHVTVIGIFAVQYGGVLYFNRALTGRLSLLVALLMVPLLYSFILNWGFANFLLGLGLTFWAAGWWLAQRHRLLVALPVACVFAVAIFLVHGLTFALYGLLVAALELGLWLQLPRRRFGALVRALLPLAAQAVAPVLMFVAAATSASADGITNADDSIARLNRAGRLADRLWELFSYRLVTILRVEEGPAHWLDAATLLLQLAIVGALVWRGRVVVARTAWPAIAVALLLVAVMPPAMFGVGFVADRMPLFAGMLLVGSLAARLTGDAFDRGALLALVAVVAVRLVTIGIGWQAYARQFDEFRSVAAQIPPGKLVKQVIVGGERLDYAQLRCQMYGPLLISLYGEAGPLFASEKQQPLRMTGKLRAAVDKLPKGYDPLHPAPDYYNRAVAASGPAGFDYLLICGAEKLTRALPADYRVIARTPHFTLAQLSG